MNSRPRNILCDLNLDSVANEIEFYQYIERYTDKEINIIKTLLFNNEEEYKNAKQLAHNKNTRKIRYKNKIKDIIKNQSYFVTFTLDPKYYNNKINTLREYLTKTLKQNFNKYIANIDYGKTTERLHFHAIINYDHSPNDKEKIKIWKYGYSKFELIYNNDTERLAKYINKLTNHALKDETKKKFNIICNRNVDNKKNK